MEEKGMIYRCPSCEAGMEYAINDQMLHCQYCGVSFSMEEWAKLWNEKNEKKLQEEKAQKEREEAERIAAEQAEILAGEKEAPPEDVWGKDGYFYDSHLDEDQIKKIQRRHATIKVQIVRCSACGAELIAGDAELTSVCAYCGQAAVIKDRVEDFMEPDYIVPFKITKDIAEGLFREKFLRTKYAPEEAKEFKAENLSAIYVPYWLYDVYIRDQRILSTKNADVIFTENDIDKQDISFTFHGIPADGSYKLSDEAAIWLTPYDLREAKPFDGAYLSGYYAERYDQGTEEKQGIVLSRAEKMFDDWFNPKNGMDHAGTDCTKIDRAGAGYSEMDHAGMYDTVTVLGSQKEKKIDACRYYLFPVWFLSFHVNDQPQTIMLNGQNGKIVGNVLSKTKILKAFLVRTLLLAAVLIPVVILLLMVVLDPPDYLKKQAIYFYLVMFSCFGMIGLSYALLEIRNKMKKMYQSLRKCVMITSLRMHESYAKKRRSGN